MSDVEPDLEASLRATLTDRAAEAPPGDDLLVVVRRHGRAQRTRRRVAAAAAAVMLGAGAAAVAVSDLNPLGGDDDAVVAEPDPAEEELITCWPGGGPSFDPDLLVDRPPLDPASALGTAATTSPPPPATAEIVAGATLVEQDGSTAHLLIWLTDTPEARNLFDSDVLGATYEQAADGSWSSLGGGACEPQWGLDDGLVPAEWVLPGERPGPDATSFTILVSEPGCSGGESPADRLAEPIIEYRDDAVLITPRLEPLPDGAYTCQGSPPAELTVELDEPLGERELLDGRWYPARPALENRGW